MKDTNKLNPEVRFSGFTDDWEQRKLGDLASIVGGGTPSTSNTEYWDGDIDWYAPAEIGEQIYVSKSKKTITELGLKKSSARILPVGTVLFTSRAGIGNTAILAKEATTNQGFQSIVPDQNKLDSYFIFSRTNELKRYGEVTGAGSTFVEVSGKQMSKMSIMVPELSEQQKIGSFFQQLDNTITLHQRKLDKLKTVKKAMLEKLFPKNGEKIPEIRFSGFTDDWEQRKVTELGEIYIGLVTTMTPHYTDHGALLIRNSDIKDGRFEFGDNPIYLDDEFAKQNASRKHRVGDVITVHTGDIGTSAVITEREAGSIGFATIVTRPNQDKITSEYLCTYLNTDTHKNFAMNISTGDGRNNYNLKDYYECIVPFPSTAEQKKISDFIGRVSTLITLHQREVFYTLKQIFYRCCDTLLSGGL